MKSGKTNSPKLSLVKAEDGTSYPALVPLDMTPGYKQLLPGKHCLIVCPSRVNMDDVLHSSVECKIKECYLNTILVGVGKYYRIEHLVSPVYLVIPKRNGRLPLYFRHKLLMGLITMSDFPQELLPHYGKETFTMSKKKRTAKKRRTGKARVKRRVLPRSKAETKAKAKTVSSKKGTKKAKVKKPSITSMIYAYFDKVGLDKAKYQRCEDIAKSVKADTKFNRSHYSWYRNQYRLKHDLD